MYFTHKISEIKVPYSQHFNQVNEILKTRNGLHTDGSLQCEVNTYSIFVICGSIGFCDITEKVMHNTQQCREKILNQLNNLKSNSSWNFDFVYQNQIFQWTGKMFVWNFKGSLWNSTQKGDDFFNVQNLGALISKSSLENSWWFILLHRFKIKWTRIWTNVARVRGDPPLLQSAMDILWRLRFSRLRQAPSRKAWYRRGPVKGRIIASYVYDNFYLWYFIMPQIMVFPCSINITARLACTNNDTCSIDSLARLIIGFKSTK